MAQKKVEVAGIGPVVLQKRRGTKNIRISLPASGEVKVGLPPWVPYQVGIKFVESKREWILKHLQQPSQTLSNGDRIGKSWRLKFEAVTSAQPAIKTRLTGNRIVIKTNLSAESPQVQIKVEAAAEKALKKEAETVLRERINFLAKKNGFSYTSLQIKKLTSRWGSCSSSHKITLSYFLMQLPWELIDYVILHELTHTQHLNHSRDFWQKMESVYPNVKNARKDLKKYKPKVVSTSVLS